MAILEDFDNRYEIFILYQSCTERLAQSEEKILQAFKEKVQIENSKNQIMLGMQKAGHTYKEVFFIKKQNDKYGDLGDENFGMKRGSIARASIEKNPKDEFKLRINPKTDEKSFSKLQWAQSISKETQRIEKKIKEIEEEEKNRVEVKNQKDRFLVFCLFDWWPAFCTFVVVFGRLPLQPGGPSVVVHSPIQLLLHLE